MPLIARAVNFGYLNGDAALLSGERFGKCGDENRHCRAAQISLYAIASAIQDLQIERDKGLIAFAVAYQVMIMPDHSTLDVLGYKLAGRDQFIVCRSQYLRPVRVVRDIGGVFKDAMGHSSILLLPDTGCPRSRF
jgi:hypothetical protein